MCYSIAGDEDEDGVHQGLVVATSCGPLRLVMDTTKTNAAYCRIRVDGGIEELGRLFGKDQGTDIITFEDGCSWLSSEAVMSFLTSDKKAVKGPAGQAYGGLAEMVPGLVCSGPLPEIKEFLKRPRDRNWFDEKTAATIKKLHGVLVCIGHKMSGSPQLEYRYSFSAQELLLTKCMPGWVRQGYMAFKYTLKSVMKSLREAQGCGKSADQGYHGRSEISTYHCKTVLLWQLDDDVTWQHEQPFPLFLLLVQRLQRHINSTPKPLLPNYFIPGCNLLESVSPSEVRFAQTLLSSASGTTVVNIFNSVSKTYHWEELFGEEETGRTLLQALVDMQGAVDTPRYEGERSRVYTLVEELDRHRLKVFPPKSKPVSLKQIFYKNTKGF